MKRGGIAIAVALAAGSVSLGTRADGQLAAFPGALGFGAQTTGARADGSKSTVYQVTNLNDSGSGSFRDAVSQSDRVIVFDVSGYIDLGSAVTCASNLTILGQTAPGGGIAVEGAETSFYGQSNDIVQYMRFLDTTNDPGGQGTSNSSGNCINLGNTNNMIFNHVSCEFASYNNIDAAGTTGANNLTFQNSIVADPIPDQQFNFHWEGNQGTFINDIFANAHNRSILGKGNLQFVNNTIYNYQAGLTTGNSGGAFNWDVIGNYFIAGPSTTSSGDAYYQVDNNQTAYAAGNYLDSNKDGTLNGSSANTVDGATTSGTILLASTSQLPQLTAANSYALNVMQSGDSITHDPNTYASSLGYDQVDQTVISQVQSLGTQGQLYGSQTSTGLSNGGLGTISTGSVVNPNYSTLLNPEGYYEVEAWANAMEEATLTPRVWSSAGGEWSTANNWASIAPLANAAPSPYELAYIEGNGAGGDGLVTVSTSTPSAFELYIGGNGGAAGEKVQVTGGNLNVQDTVTVGYLNSGILEIDSGAVQAANVQLGNTSGSTTYNGSLILNGGVLQTGQVVLGGGAPGSWTTGGSMTFNGGTIQADGSLNINAPGTILAGGGTIDTNGSNGTISSALGGTGALTKFGAGTLDLTGTNTFSGGAVLEGGELAISSNANIGGANGTISFLGGVLQVQGTALANLNTHPFNTSTFNGGFDIVAANNTFTVSQNLGGAGSLTLNGAGELVLSGSNSFSGGTIINGGTLDVSTDNNLGAVGGTVDVNGGVLEVDGTALTGTANHPLSGVFSGGFNITNAAEVFDVTQQVNGTGNLTKYGPGTLELGTRDYLSGEVFLEGGTVRIGDPLSLRYITVDFDAAGATVDLNGIQGATIGAITGSQNFDMKGDNPAIGNNNASTEYDGILSSSVAGGFQKIGTGTLTLTGANTYTGVTQISTGILSVATLANGGAPSPIGAATNAQANLVFNGGTLQYTGAGGGTDHLFDLTANGGTLDASGSAAVTFSNTSVLSPTAAANVTLTLTGTNTGHNTFEPALADPAGGYTTSLTMSGTGLWDFSGGAKTYSGMTTVASGELQTLSSNDLSKLSTVTIAAGAVLDFHGYSETINGLNGSGAITNSYATASNVFTIGYANGSGSFGGTLGSGASNLAKVGSGSQVLAGSSSYTGTTTVNGGMLQFNLAAAIGGTGVTVTVGAGATAAAGYAIDQTDFLNRITTTSTGCAALAVNSANNLNFSSGTGGANLPTVSLGAVGNATYTGTLTPYGTNYLLGGGGGNLTLSNTNALTGNDTLQVVGQGTVSLTSTNNLTGITTIGNGGVLAVSSLANGGAISSIGSNSNAAANIVLDGGTLRYVGAATSTDRSFMLTANGGTLDGSGSAGIVFNSPNPVAFIGTGNRTLTLSGTESHSNFQLVLGDSASGQTSVNVNTTSRWLWVSPAASVTYSGNTTVSSGELELYGGSGGGQIPSGAGKGNLLVNTGGEFYITGNSGINALDNGPAGGGTVTGSGGNLTLGNGNASGNYGGAISGPISLTKAGLGTQTLTGASLTYTGSTNVSAGTLTLDSTNSGAALTASSSVTVQGGATLQLISVAASGGTVAILPSTETVYLTTVGGTPTLELTLNNNTQNVGAFEINGVIQPTGLYSATSAPAGATADEAYFSGNGTLDVVPEPTVIAELSGIGAAALLRRRRRPRE
jgi:fibronectin-binding autotransporter adhesin